MRVLLVDDDEPLRRSMARVLSRDAIVIGVATAAEVLALIAAGERFDVLVCDYHLPDLTGTQLHARLRIVAPELARATVFVTGDADLESVRISLASLGPILSKPVSGAELRQAVAYVAASLAKLE
jgi:CheY-like chemotaxis protein